MKILLVEDSATLRYAHASYVEEAGHSVVLAQTGEEALQLLEHTPVDLIVMDVEMPGLDGFETTRLMREWLGDFWVPIIFVTGKSDDASFLAGIEAGGDDYLIKPVSRVILKAKIAAMARLVSMRDELTKLNSELEILSQRDGLTQVYNRHAFEKLGQQQWLMCSRKNLPVSIAMIDLDHFKSFNDSYGHAAGDNCLVSVASVMRECVQRPADMLARYGGEEFVVLLPDTDASGALKVANLIRDSIEQLAMPHHAAATSNVVTASIGVATTQHIAGKSLRDLMRCADKALYKSKRSGRNRVTAEELSAVKSLLLVDDDETVHEFLEATLQGICQITIADNGPECVELVESLQPDLIVLDSRMPGLNRKAVYGTLKSICHEACIPIVLLAKSAPAVLQRNGKKFGATDCLSKKTDWDVLASRILSYLYGGDDTQNKSQ